MTTRNGDMPAMPNSNPETYPTPCPLQWGYGLTKRELLAMAAMQGLAASGKWHKTKVPCEAVKMADALLTELDKV